MKKIGGIRRKTRSKLKKPIKDKGKLRLSKYFQHFKVDDKVVLSAEPSVQKGMYHPRFHGKIGIVKGTHGKCYEVEIKDAEKTKSLIVHPIHLMKRSK